MTEIVNPQHWVVNSETYMNLKIYVEDSTLKNEYIKSVEKHNTNACKSLYDAGFDLFSPLTYELDDKTNLHKLDFKIKCAATMVTESGKNYNTGFYMYPRSSLSKTKLRLANSVGIIDAGYRGNLIGMFDVLEKTTILSNDRLLQICSPNLCPIIVQIVDTEEELGAPTERGVGGFGSTGR